VRQEDSSDGLCTVSLYLGTKVVLARNSLFFGIINIPMLKCCTIFLQNKKVVIKNNGNWWGCCSYPKYHFIAKGFSFTLTETGVLYGAIVLSYSLDNPS